MAIRIKSKDSMTKPKTKNTNVPKLFSKPSYLTKITLKKPYLEAVALRFIFVRNAGEIEDRAPISTEFLFQRPYINKTGSFRIMPFKDYIFI